jgi:hypothetical protein
MVKKEKTFPMKNQTMNHDLRKNQAMSYITEFMTLSHNFIQNLSTFLYDTNTGSNGDGSLSVRCQGIDILVSLSIGIFIFF